MSTTCVTDLVAGTRDAVEIGFGGEKSAISVEGESLLRDGLSAPQFGLVHRRASVLAIRPQSLAAEARR